MRAGTYRFHCTDGEHAVLDRAGRYLRSRADLHAEAKQALNAGEGTVQMLVRIGHADPVAPAARRELQDFIRA